MLRSALLLVVAILLGACTDGTPAPQSQVVVRRVPTATAIATPTVTPQPFPLLFASDATGAGALYLLEGAGPARQVTDPSASPAWQPDLLPDGEQVLFTGRRNGQSDLALVPLQGGTIQWLTTHPADDYSPSWSRDGKKIAWVSERGGKSQVWMMEPGAEAAGRPLPGVHGERISRHPEWTADDHLLFSALNEVGQEELYRYDPQSDNVVQLTHPPLKGSQPSANANGDIVFIGWEERPPWRGVYILRAGEEQPSLLWETTQWLGDPAWSNNGKWILFTSWSDARGGQDLWALPSTGGTPQRLTDGPAWEGDALPLAGASNAVPPTLLGQSRALRAPLPVLGFNIANLDNAYLSHFVGFNWAKGFANWERTEPQPGVYNWIDIDNTVDRFEEAGLEIFLRVDRTPEWARPPDTTGSHAPTDLEAFGRWLETLATRYRGRVAAYELWNEPNLRYEWGNQHPDPAYYVQMLYVAREALQRGDPEAELVVGALAVTGDGNEQAMGDLEWMEGFYQALDPARPRPYDAFSTHPYGFGKPPSMPPEEGLGLRHLETQRALMEKWGDTSPMWLTELGYPHETPAWDLGEHEAWAVSEELQAQYIVETLDWIAAHYPFVEAVFLFNLDFSTVDWYHSGEQMRSYALLDSSRRPLPAFSLLRRWALSELPSLSESHE